MPEFDKIDKDKIRDMEWDTDKQRYVGKNGEELKVTPYSDGSGYKYDYYDRPTYGNNEHNSTHVKADKNENWERTDNDRDKGTQEKSSGSGCYLTTACISHYKDNFDDNCYELRVLRWFRDNYVSANDIVLYQEEAPNIVSSINSQTHSNLIYNYIYDNVVDACVEAIENGNYDFAYNRYKDSLMAMQEKFTKNTQPKLVKTLV